MTLDLSNQEVKDLGGRYSKGRPIIGILAHEFHSSPLNDKYPNQYDSYIAASYVKFVEGAGAMVVPIWIGKEESYYEDIISKVNGVMSINHDLNGLEFISTIEHVDFPFYGTQFHPETNLYEWMEPEKYITHTAEATLASQYFANFFVNKARKNSHSYPEGTEIEELIYNYPVTFTVRENLPFTQCCMFANETKNDL